MKLKSTFNYYGLLALFLYITLVFGFYIDENLNFGAMQDWKHTDLPVINDLSFNIKETLLNYNSYGHRHSPVYLIFLSLFKRVGFSFDSIRFLHLNLSLFLIFVFYKCLILKFYKIEKNILLLISLSIFLSPTFRSLAIWPSSRMIGLMFFTISVLEFLRYLETPKKIYMWKNIIFLIISSYISPNFSLFIIFFLHHYLSKKNFKDLIQILLFCFFSSLPAFYYIFILDVNFLIASTPGQTLDSVIGLSFNLSNKILIISTIIFFQLLPFLANKNFITNFLKLPKKDFLIISIFLIINLYFFNYEINFTGGGIFFQLSNFFFNNNYLFYFISFISLILIANFLKNNISNFLIFFLLIISNIQNTIYHKYYDPFIMILFFTLINNSLSYKFFDNRSKVFYIYYFYLIYILIRIIKNYYLS
ncbi:hypothetical protein OAL77_01920 [Candidatus Pelagibacter sp.]|nr:hypothetical protein [Candidatus Pelagibacter sp.]